MTNQSSLEEIIKNSKFTVLLGKNGSGKSTKLRTLDTSTTFNTKYISPERGGNLKYDAGVENAIATQSGWLADSRRKNRTENFRQQSSAQFRTLEVLVLREIEKDVTKRNDHGYTFDRTIQKLNDLLPAIKLIRSERGFSIQSKNDLPIDEEQISSGESELISLAIEVLVFSRSEITDKTLLLDEPDVHLHPDLQQKFIVFVESVAVENDIRVVIATHSTAILGAFSEAAKLKIIPISNKDQNEFNSFTRSKICDEILPIFGAHPLSSVFNLNPVVLVEGEDDKRVLEQVIRSSNGKLRFSPCVVESVTELSAWENWLNQFLPVLYDNARGFSLRDLDDSQQTEIDDIGVVCRVRLNCYAIENLLLTNQCLLEHEFTAETFKVEMQRWLGQFPNHNFAADLGELINNFEDRRTKKIKNLRNIIVALLGSNKPWEVIVGQSIASNIADNDSDQHSISSYLGTKAKNYLFVTN